MSSSRAAGGRRSGTRCSRSGRSERCSSTWPGGRCGACSSRCSNMQSWLARLFSHRLRALVQKELNQIKRDRRIMLSLILPPILQLMLFGTVMDPSVANVQLGIVDDSQSLESRGLVAALSESGSFKLRSIYPSVEALGYDLSQGVVDAGIVIPSDFSRDLMRTRAATVQV